MKIFLGAVKIISQLRKAEIRLGVHVVDNPPDAVVCRLERIQHSVNVIRRLVNILPRCLRRVCGIRRENVVHCR